MNGGTSDAETASAPTISTVVRRGLDALDDSITHAKAFDSGTSKVTLEDERGRLKVWASNLGALQPATSPKSLDHRLRDAPLMRKSVHAGLDRVLISVARASHILDGSAPNRTGSPIPDDRDSGSEVRVTTELDELLLGIHSAISHLFGLSMLIRRQRPKGRLPVLESFQPAERSPDISNVTDKFPKAKSTPWLAQRLGNEITRRREIIRYRQYHREGLANTVNNKHEGRSDTATLATTFQETDLPGAATQNREAVTSSRVSVFTSGTSYLSAEDSTNTGRGIPDLPDMCLDGVQLQYGERFECPYCRTIQEVNNRFEWKKHVMSDLQPYVCTIQDCSASTHLFPTRAEWFRHEFTVHRLQWACNWCDGPQATFHSAEGLKRHFAKTHPGDVTDGQMPLILESCERPMTTFGPSSCPLCTEWEAFPPQNTAKGFGRHLARHLQHLALDALPLSIEGLEIQASEGLIDEADESVSGESGNEGIGPSKPDETTREALETETESQFLGMRQAETEEAKEGAKEEPQEIVAESAARLKARVEALQRAKREIEEAQAFTEDQAREQLEAEKKLDAGNAWNHAELIAQVQQEVVEPLEAYFKSAEELETREHLARMEAEAAARANFELALQTEAKAKADLELKLRTETKLKAEDDPGVGEDSTKGVVRFTDALGRKFAFPLHICSKWGNMQGLIEKAFRDVQIVGPEVLAGRYDLVGPDGVIHPQDWEKTIKTGMRIDMKMHVGSQSHSQGPSGLPGRGRLGDSSDGRSTRDLRREAKSSGEPESEGMEPPVRPTVGEGHQGKGRRSRFRSLFRTVG